MTDHAVDPRDAEIARLKALVAKLRASLHRLEAKAVSMRIEAHDTLEETGDD